NVLTPAHDHARPGGAMTPRFRQSLCLSVAVLSTVAAAGILQTPARAMGLNSFGGFGRGMSGFGHGTGGLGVGGLGAGGAVNGLGGFGDRIHVHIPSKVNVPDKNIRVRTSDSGSRGAIGAGGKLDERPGSRRGHRIVYRPWRDGPECG